GSGSLAQHTNPKSPTYSVGRQVLTICPKSFRIVNAPPASLLMMFPGAPCSGFAISTCQTLAALMLQSSSPCALSKRTPPQPFSATANSNFPSALMSPPAEPLIPQKLPYSQSSAPFASNTRTFSPQLPPRPRKTGATPSFGWIRTTGLNMRGAKRTVFLIRRSRPTNAAPAVPTTASSDSISLPKRPYRRSVICPSSGYLSKMTLAKSAFPRSIFAVRRSSGTFGNSGTCRQPGMMPALKRDAMKIKQEMRCVPNLGGRPIVPPLVRRTDYSRLITLARYPAPKPLSIFTTQTLGEQLLSMPSSAATPRKLAPYPTLEGTAI